MGDVWFDMDDLTAFLGEEAFENDTPEPNVGSDGAVQLDGVAQSEKPKERKRNVSVEQARRLEASFNQNNRLEPNQKIRLAKELGLHPRQVLVWFQNRRARIKGKELEAEYYTLKDQYDSLKIDYDCLFMEKERLQTQVSALSNKLKRKTWEEPNPGTMNGSMSSAGGKKSLVAPGLPLQEDPLKGLEAPPMDSMFGLGLSEGEGFNSVLGGSFDYFGSGMDGQSPFWSSQFGF